MNKLILALWSYTVFILAGTPLAWANSAELADPDIAWKNYARTETDIRPSYQFPHASCFRAAAVAYQVPESLLLAVARGESNFKETANHWS